MWRRGGEEGGEGGGSGSFARNSAIYFMHRIVLDVFLLDVCSVLISVFSPRGKEVLSHAGL